MGIELFPPANPASDPDLTSAEPWPARHRSPYGSAFLRFADQLGAAAMELLAAAVPVDCVCCGAEDRALCAGCSRRVRRLSTLPFRAEGGAPALMDVSGRVLLPVVAAGVYREELAQALLSFKRHGQYQVRHSLAQALAGALRGAAPDGAAMICVPVPTSTAAFAARGFSPVHSLLGLAARQVPGVAVADVLARTGNGHPQVPGGQKGLDRGDRARRVRGSMRVRRGAAATVAGKACIIVDDVLTTGATLAEAARALHLAGAFVRGAVVLAATRPPGAADASAIPAGAQGSHPVLEKNKPEKGE